MHLWAYESNMLNRRAAGSIPAIGPVVAFFANAPG